MSGLWVRSQDGNTLVFVKTFEIWQGGRIVARFGKDWKLLGDYDGTIEAKEILNKVEKFITVNPNKTFQMPGGKLK